MERGHHVSVGLVTSTCVRFPKEWDALDAPGVWLAGSWASASTAVPQGNLTPRLQSSRQRKGQSLFGSTNGQF